MIIVLTMQFSRYLHRTISGIIVLPFLVIAITGLLLQTKRWVPSLQPESKTSLQGSLNSDTQTLIWSELFASVAAVKEAGVKEWKDIRAIDIRPALGVARVRTQNGFEVQLDLHNGTVLSAAPRYTGLLIELHEGSFWGSWMRNWIFLPTSLLILVLTLSGAIVGLSQIKENLRRYRKRKSKFKLSSSEAVHGSL